MRKLIGLIFKFLHLLRAIVLDIKNPFLLSSMRIV